jgi:hypothetical protein
MYMSKHAQKRAQSRSVPIYMIEQLLQYGAEQSSRRATKIYVDRQCLDEMREDLGKAQYAKVEGKLRKVYAVRSRDGVIITTGYRYKNLVKTRRRRHAPPN